jgi:hypothetical protein
MKEDCDISWIQIGEIVAYLEKKSKKSREHGNERAKRYDDITEGYEWLRDADTIDALIEHIKNKIRVCGHEWRADGFMHEVK